MAQPLTALLASSAWLLSALRDFLFAFTIEDSQFELNQLHADVLGLEKALKGVLLLDQGSEFEHLDRQSAIQCINKLAKGHGHDIGKMCEEARARGLMDVRPILEGNFGAYPASSLLLAVQDSYFETRYPLPPNPAYRRHEIGEGTFHDPLHSSGITEFIHAVGRECFLAAAKHIDLAELLRRFQDDFGSVAAYERFHRIFWDGRLPEACSKYVLGLPPKRI